jgi:hypothetical protein
VPNRTDASYAEKLMSVLLQDMSRLSSDAAWSSVVIWEAEELLRQAESLRVPREQATRMMQVAEQALAGVREARARQRSARVA